ncbi:CTR1 [Auxenochlorella protothecoides x Auxenochlorella symbiontica]
MSCPSRCALALLLALLAPLAALGAANDACWTDPTASTCATLLLSSTKLWTDLNATCNTGSATVEGWPAACSLREACVEAGTLTACNPMSLILAACTEDSTISTCEKYKTLCGTGSVVPACTSAKSITGLTSATSFYNDVQTLCSSMTMTGCSNCVAVSGTPTAAQLQASCPNPLGTLAELCLEMSMDGCGDWTTFCASNAAAFPGLCSSTPAAGPSPAMAMSPSMDMSPAATPSPSSSHSNWAVGGCYDDPTTASCTDFVQPTSITEANITVLCDSMPFMSGCTLHNMCNAGTASGTYCDPFSILADLCVDMPGMNGCQGWVALCSASGTKVAQCTQHAAVPNLVITFDAMDQVIDMCGQMYMDGCSDCTSRTACPNPILTLAQVCQGMPSMPECASYTAMCDGGAAGTFATLCSSDPAGSSTPPMKMYMHAAWTELILFQAWVPRNKGEYIASCLAMIATAILVQFLKSLRLRLEAVWASRLRTSCCGGDGAASDSGSESLGAGGSKAYVGASGCAGPAPAPGLWAGWRVASLAQLRRNVVRSLFTGVVVFLDYMLMLVVMTFNIGLIVSTVLGFALGALLFGHIGEVGDRAAAAPTAAGNENELEVQFVEPGSCCGNRQV